MKCPRCRSEIENQHSCPYCGFTAQFYGSVREGSGTAAANGNSKRSRQAEKEILNRLGRLEMRTNLLLVLGAANFFLLLLILIVYAMGV